MAKSPRERERERAASITKGGLEHGFRTPRIPFHQFQLLSAERNPRRFSSVHSWVNAQALEEPDYVETSEERMAKPPPSLDVCAPWTEPFHQPHRAAFVALAGCLASWMVLAEFKS